MSRQPQPALTEIADPGNIHTTEAFIPVTANLTARHAALLLVTDYGLVNTEKMGPGERLRHLTAAVERRARIDTTETDVATIRQMLVESSSTRKPEFVPPSVIDNETDDNHLAPLEPVTRRRTPLEPVTRRPNQDE